MTLPDTEAAFLLIIYSARGGMVTYDYIHRVLSNDKLSHRNTGVYARKVRVALQDMESIKNVRGLGYYMPRSWVERMDNANG